MVKDQNSLQTSANRMNVRLLLAEEQVEGEVIQRNVGDCCIVDVRKNNSQQQAVATLLNKANRKPRARSVCGAISTMCPDGTEGGKIG